MHLEESQYYTIRVERTVREDNGAPLLALRLDHLLHSHTDPADPLHLEYGYLRLFNEVVAEITRRRPSPRFLFIGGGGYTLPRRIAHEHPAAEVDVVEIDSAVTRVAYRFLGVPREIRTFNEDARWFAVREHPRCDAIFIDAQTIHTGPTEIFRGQSGNMILRATSGTTSTLLTIPVRYR